LASGGNSFNDFLRITWSKKSKRRGTRRHLPPRAWTYLYGPAWRISGREPTI